MTNEPPQPDDPHAGAGARAGETSLSGDVAGLDERGAEPATWRPVVVAAVLVVHDGAPWLNECLDGLAQQTRPPDRLFIVDTGSIDESREICSSHDAIRQVIGQVMAVDLPRECTFGEAVADAVDRLTARLPLSVEENGEAARTGGSESTGTTVGSESTVANEASESTGATQWLWLLHDDSAAAPDALGHLLDAARRSPSVGIAGPKLTTWDDPSRLLEMGQQVTRSGGRAGGPAPGEPDQGQHDSRSDVLGVNTSGMLVRRDVFESLGGFDPHFGQFGDDLDLCWRAHLTGHRVVVAPKARVREAAASANGRRSADHSAGAARRRRRRHARQVALARCSPYAVPFVALWVAVSSIASAAVLLVVKRPARAWEQLSDLGSLMTPWRPIAARWRSRGVSRIRRRDLRGLFVSPVAGLRHGLDMVHDAVAFGSGNQGNGRAGDGAISRAGSTHALETGPVSEAGESVERLTAPITVRVLRNPGFLAVLVAAGLAVATWRSLLVTLISTNSLGVSGGELLPVSADAAGLWHAWFDGWHGAGLGNALEPAPYLPILSAMAWPLEHLPIIDTPASSVGTVIGWLLAAAIPLSACTAYLGARVATRAPWPRAWASLAWASLATLTTAQASGRLGAVVAHILLPLVAAGFVCATRRSTPMWVTFGTALALAVMGAFNPTLAALGAAAALILLLVGVALMLAGHGATRLRAAFLLLVPAGLLGPSILRLAEAPLQVLGGPGLTHWQGAAPAPWQLAMLHPGGPGSYPVLLSAPILIAGVAALLRRGTASGSMTALALVAVIGLALGVASPHVIVGLVPSGLPGAGGAITMWAGTGLDVAGLALIAAAVVGQDGLLGRLSLSGFGWRQILAPPVVAAAVVGVMVSVVLAGSAGVGAALTPKPPNMPAVAADQAEGPSGNRLLVLSNDAGTVTYRLIGREPGTLVRDLPVPAAAPDPLLAAAVRAAVEDPDATPANAPANSPANGAAKSPANAPDSRPVGKLGTSAFNNVGAGAVKPSRDGLADLGVGFVAFRGAPSEPLVGRLDATAGLTRLSDSQGLILWRVQPRVNAVTSSRLRVVNARGVALMSVNVTGDHARTDVRVHAAKAGVPRRLVVAEPAGWEEHARVIFAGHTLSSARGASQPTYDLPSAAGQLTVDLQPTRPWWRWAQLGLLLIVLFLAVPIGSSRLESPTTSRRNP